MAYLNKRVRNETKSKELVPPDGGWGWIVVIAIAAISAFHLSFVIVFALIYGTKIEDMGHGTKGSSLVANLAFLIQNFFGPFSGQLIKATSCRMVILWGIGLATFGVILSGFSTQLWHLIVTFSIIRGIGMSMISSPSFVVINQYFTVKKGRAVGFSTMGASLGQIVMPYIVRYLMDEYSFQGTTLIIGALGLNAAIAALLIQPVKWHMKRPATIKSEEELVLNENTLKLEDVPNSTKIDFTDKELSPLQGPSKETTTPLNKKSRLKSIVSSFDLELLANYRFTSIIIGNALAFSTVLNFSVLSPFFFVDMMGFDKKNATILLSIMSIADIVGRFFLPIFTDYLKIKATHSIIFSCALIAIVRQAMVYTSSFTAIAILLILNGLGKTLIIVNQNIVVSDTCRREQVPSAVGLYMVAKALVILPSGYLVGWIRDYTGSFENSILSLNIMIIVVVIMWLPPILSDICGSRQRRNNDIIS